MSDLLDDLVREHRKIGAVLAALQTFAAMHAKKMPNAREILGHFVLFFCDYLDRWHHGKEEDLLFPAMIVAGLPADAGPIRCMLREHEQGRNLLAGLAVLCEGKGSLTPAELGLLGELSVGYAQLLALHIAKENQMLYPLAERLLSADQRSTLDSSAAAVDARWGQGGLDLQEMGAALCSRFGGLSERPPA